MHCDRLVFFKSITLIGSSYSALNPHFKSLDWKGGGGGEVGMTTVTKTTAIQTNTDLAMRQRRDHAPIIAQTGAESHIERSWPNVRSAGWRTHRSQTSTPLRLSARPAAHPTEHALMDLPLITIQHRRLPCSRGKKKKACVIRWWTKQNISKAFSPRSGEKMIKCLSEPCGAESRGQVPKAQSGMRMGWGGRYRSYSISFECVGDFPWVPGLINESVARSVAPDYRWTAFQTNLFDSALMMAAFSNLLVTQPVESVLLGEERKSNTCLSSLQ